MVALTELVGCGHVTRALIEISRDGTILLGPIDCVPVVCESNERLGILLDSTGDVGPSLVKVRLDRLGTEVPVIVSGRIDVTATSVERGEPAPVSDRRRDAPSRMAATSARTTASTMTSPMMLRSPSPSDLYRLNFRGDRPEHDPWWLGTPAPNYFGLALDISRSREKILMYQAECLRCTGQTQVRPRPIE